MDIETNDNLLYFIIYIAQFTTTSGSPVEEKRLCLEENAKYETEFIF
jgi:hypothetical protein